MAPQVPARALVVEDEIALGRVYVRALEAAGHLVDHAADGAAGLARMSEGNYDVVVSDVHMPRMGGIDLLAEIRRTWPDVPVIMTTAQRDADTYARAREIGTVRYLIKPVPLEKLASAVDAAIKLRNLLVRTRQRRERSGAAGG